MATKQVRELPIAAKDLEAFRRKKIQNMIDASVERIEETWRTLCEEFDRKFSEGKWVFMSRPVEIDGNKEGADAAGVYYVHDIAGLMPDLSTQSFGGQYGESSFKQSDLHFAGLEGVLPTETEARRCFNNDRKYFRDSNGCMTINGNIYDGLNYFSGHEIWFLYLTQLSNSSFKQGNRNTGKHIAHIPIFRFNGINSERLPAARALLYWLQYDLMPLAEEFDNQAGRDAFLNLKKFYGQYGDFMTGAAQGISLNRKKVFAAVMKGETFDFLPGTKQILSATSIEGDDKYIKNLEDFLLNCDQRRIHLTPYGKNRLYGPNEGHWEIWPTDEDDTAGKVILKQSFTARDPAGDVKQGIVGIDFGTKSTVVVYESDGHKRQALRIGSGDYKRKAMVEDYENPTVMRFIDFESFLSAYNAREGRPFTSWNDLTVSHTAYKSLLETDSKSYYSFFDGLKHWCGTPGEQVKIRDGKGTEWDLPEFLKLSDDQPNPIEIYAYYLGLYINNMIRGEIILNYIMSFPVTYEAEVREKIRVSFERGIRNSFPPALLKNEEAMKSFYVVQGASEPAAYAVTALEEYGFDPEGDEENYYGVFDFGGGTTDFDFGVFKESERSSYDYMLRHFGANGDKTLGGENLLRLLAFHVFKENLEKLMQPDPNKTDSAVIPFTVPAGCKAPEGYEILINQYSQEARANTHNLMEKLRPVWEAPESGEAKVICAEGITLTLFNENGEAVTGVKLKVGENAVECNVGQPEEHNETQISLQAFFDYKKYWYRDCKPEEITKSEKRKLFFLARLVKLKKFNAMMQSTEQWERFINRVEDDSTTYHNRHWDFFFDFIDEYGNFDVYLSDEAKEMHHGDDTSPATKDKTADPISSNYLNDILRERIEQGVKNFFYAMRQAFAGASAANFIKPITEAGDIAIFLAGNSSKAELVRGIFDEYISGEKKAAELLGVNADEVNFALFPPLGTPEAEAIQKERGVTLAEDRLSRPTGKTGVAFGLISCRDSGNIEVSDITPDEESENAFQYYIGREKKKKFITVIDRTTKMNVWYEFLDSAEKPFEILYTDIPEAVTNQASVAISRRHSVRPEHLEPEAQIYIRPVGSYAVDYAIAMSREALESGDFLVAPVRIELNRRGE